MDLKPKKSPATAWIAFSDPIHEHAFPTSRQNNENYNEPEPMPRQDRFLSTPEIFRPRKTFNPNMRSQSSSNLYHNIGLAAPRNDLHTHSSTDLLQPSIIHMQTPRFYENRSIEIEDLEIESARKHRRKLPPVESSIESQSFNSMFIKGHSAIAMPIKEFQPALDIDVSNRPRSNPQLTPITDRRLMTPRDISSSDSTKKRRYETTEPRQSTSHESANLKRTNNADVILHFTDENNNQQLSTYQFSSKPSNIKSSDHDNASHRSGKSENSSFSSGSSIEDDNKLFIKTEIVSGTNDKTLFENTNGVLKEHNKLPAVGTVANNTEVDVTDKNKIQQVRSSYKLQVSVQDQAVGIMVHNNIESKSSVVADKNTTKKVVTRNEKSVVTKTSKTTKKKGFTTTKTKRLTSTVSEKSYSTKKTTVKHRRAISEVSQKSKTQMKKHDNPLVSKINSSLHLKGEDDTLKKSDTNVNYYKIWDEQNSKTERLMDEFKHRHDPPKELIEKTLVEPPKDEKKALVFTFEKPEPKIKTPEPLPVLPAVERPVQTPVIVEAYPTCDRQEKELIAKITEAPIHCPLPRRIQSAKQKMVTQHNSDSKSPKIRAKSAESSQDKKARKKSKKNSKNSENDCFSPSDFNPDTQAIIGGSGWGIVVDKTKYPDLETDADPPLPAQTSSGPKSEDSVTFDVFDQDSPKENVFLTNGFLETQDTVFIQTPAVDKLTSVGEDLSEVENVNSNEKNPPETDENLTHNHEITQIDLHKPVENETFYFTKKSLSPIPEMLSRSLSLDGSFNSSIRSKHSDELKAVMKYFSENATGNKPAALVLPPPPKQDIDKFTSIASENSAIHIETADSSMTDYGNPFSPFPIPKENFTINDSSSVDENAKSSSPSLIKEADASNNDSSGSKVEVDKVKDISMSNELMVSGVKVEKEVNKDDITSSPTNDQQTETLNKDEKSNEKQKIRTKRIKREKNESLEDDKTNKNKRGIRRRWTEKELKDLARKDASKNEKNWVQFCKEPHNEFRAHILRFNMLEKVHEEPDSILDAILAEGCLMNMFYPDEVSNMLFPETIAESESGSESESDDENDDVSVISNTVPELNDQNEEMNEEVELVNEDEDDNISVASDNSSTNSHVTIQNEAVVNGNVQESSNFDDMDNGVVSGYDTETEFVKQLERTQKRSEESDYDSELQLTDTEPDPPHGQLQRTLTVENLKEHLQYLKEEQDENSKLVDIYLQKQVSGRIQRPGSQMSNMTTETETSVSSYDSILDTNACKDFKRGKLLGNGAFGKVYEAMVGHHHIAVKVIELGGLFTSQHEIEAQYTQLQNEVDILKSLRHENIVGYIGSQLEGREVLIFMEQLAGGTIESKLKQYGSFDEKTIRKYTTQILHGVKYLHDNGVVHRDIKGQNIMVAPPNTLKLIDFGCATEFNEEEEGSSSGRRKLQGTPFWMAPEIIEQSAISSKSDIWSIACTVFEMATTRPPFYSNNSTPMSAMYKMANKTTMPEVDKRFSNRCRDFVKICFEYDPKKRPSVDYLLSHIFIIGKRRSRASMNDSLS